MLRFFYNGIKGSDGKLQKAHYSGGPWNTLEDGTLTIYASEYERFSAEVRAAFVVHNDSDSQSDYFVKDHIRVAPSHPLHAAVADALAKQEAHRAATVKRRDDRRRQKNEDMLNDFNWVGSRHHY